MTTLDAALRYSEAGYPVFPLRGKQPLTEHGFKDASRDADTIRRWWTTWPEAGIGVPTGSGSGVVVLDVDPRHGGDASLAELKRKYGELPPCPRVKTGGGGWNYWLAHPSGTVRTAHGFRPGLDLQSDAAYVVVPPSPHPSGGVYSWEVALDGTKLPLPPPWLLELADGGGSGRAVAPVELGPDGKLPHGRHHDWLLSFTASFASKTGGVTVAQVVAAARAAFAEVGDDLPAHEAEIRGAARSAVEKYGRAAPEGPKPPEDGAALFRDLVEGWKIHVYLPAEWEYRILALFCLQSRLAPRLPRSFYLYPAGPKGSGKTTILDHISEVTHALRFQNVSLPTLARSMSERPAPTVAVDEYDITTGDRGVDEARDALVRQGYKANAAPFKRSELVHGKVVPVEFPIYGPKVLTFRGQVEDALQDRGFILPTEKGKDYAFVVRAISPRWGDLISRLDAWGSAALPGLDPARLLERLESPDFQDRVRRVLGVLEATRNAELVTVALLVAEAAGVDLEAELREALGAKEREAAENEWVEALGDILPRLAKNSPKLEASPFYVLKQSAVKAELDRIRKERRLPPCSAAEFAGWRRDLGIRSDWIRKRARAAYWNLPKEFVEDLGSQGPGSLTSLASLLSRDERGNHVSPVNPSGEGTRSLRGAPTLADSPTSHEPPPRPEVSPVSDPNLPGRDPEDLLGPAPTLADRARDNSREAGSLPLDPPGEEGS